MVPRRRLASLSCMCARLSPVWPVTSTLRRRLGPYRREALLSGVSLRLSPVWPEAASGVKRLSGPLHPAPAVSCPCL